MDTKKHWTLAKIEAEMATVDWVRVAALTDEEIEAAAAADPDSYLPTDEELEAAVRARDERLRKLKKPAAE